MQMFIMIGPSGSGKTTLAKKLAKEHDAVVCSADDYFVDDDGNYKFEPSLLGEAHKACRQKCLVAIQQKKNVVIDNTNTTQKEIWPYVQTAILWEMPVTLMTAPAIFMDARRLHKRSTHGVPLKTIQRQQERIAAMYGCVTLQ